MRTSIGKSTLPDRVWTAAELRHLPPQQRDAILAAAAAAAEAEYRSDAALTAFEAFGEEDLHGHSSDAGRAEIIGPQNVLSLRGRSILL